MTALVRLPDAAATAALGQALARSMPSDSRGLLVTLDGELGAGKTTLVRAFLIALGHDGAVPSPTYTLVEPYELAGVSIYHVDLYRIADAAELEFLGWDDLRSGLVLVEWPGRAESLTAGADLALDLAYDGAGRSCATAAGSATGRAWLKALQCTLDAG